MRRGRLAMELFDGISFGDRLFVSASGLLRGARDGAGLVQTMAAITAAAEEEARVQGERPSACRAGCPNCCVLNVTVLPPEAAAIAVRLGSGLSADGREALIARLDRQWRTVRWMEDGERVRRQICCPFLDGAGSCSIHPFRPLLCRGVTSSDSELCREALDPTELDVPFAVPMDLAHRMVMDEAFRALDRALAECGMETHVCELSAGVWAFLAQPELYGRLLAGGRISHEVWE